MIDVPEGLEAGQGDEVGRAVPANKIDTLKFIGDARDCSRNNRLSRLTRHTRRSGILALTMSRPTYAGVSR